MIQDTIDWSVWTGLEISEVSEVTRLTQDWYSSEKIAFIIMSPSALLPDVRAVINDNKLVLFGHVRRLPEGTLAHDVLHASVESHAGKAPWYDILVGEESQEDRDVPGYVTLWKQHV